MPTSVPPVPTLLTKRSTPRPLDWSMISRAVERRWAVAFSSLVNWRGRKWPGRAPSFSVSAIAPGTPAALGVSRMSPP